MLRNSREIPKIDDNRPEFLTLFNTYHVFFRLFLKIHQIHHLQPEM